MSTTSKKRRILPGFGLAMGTTLFWLALIVLLPLSTLFFKSAHIEPAAIWATISSPRAIAAYRLTFGASFAAAAVNCVFGFLVAWVLSRYEFPGKKFIDAMVDLPFALPTAIAGIALTTVYAPHGVLGSILMEAGIRVAFTPLGIVTALIFIGLPFVVRTIQPVIEDLDPAVEEAASSLGASRLQVFLRVILPSVIPALITGFTMAFARALGEFGSVVFIAGNMPGKTEIIPLLIMTKLEQFDYNGATAIALVMLLSSFSLFLLINKLQSITSRRTGHAS